MKEGILKIKNNHWKVITVNFLKKEIDWKIRLRKQYRKYNKKTKKIK